MTIIWHDPTMEGGREYAAKNDDQRHASALRLLNEWYQWENVEQTSDEAKAMRKILDAGDGEAAYAYVTASDSVEVR